MNIRPYAPRDFEVVISLFRESVPKFFDPAEERDLVLFLTSAPTYYFVMEVEGEVVACGGLVLNPSDASCRVAWDFVGAKHYGKGYGSRLFDYRLGVVKGWPAIDTIYSYTSQYSFGFYQKQGFQVVRTEPDYWAKGYDLVLMMREV